MRMTRVLALLIIGLPTANALAYEVETHERITRRAVGLSWLQTDPNLLTSMGLLTNTQVLPTQEGPKTIVDIIAMGSRLEDDRTGPGAYPPLRHFYDPTTGEPLYVPPISREQSVPSPDWALEETRSFDNLTVGQTYSFRDARSRQFKALTGLMATNRDRYWGLALETIGHVAHHLQDMSQPQHVRNDGHCDSQLCRVFGMYSPSRYEKFTNRLGDSVIALAPKYAAVYDESDRRLDSARRLWHTEAPAGRASNGLGIAEYTNRGFVSANSNFDKLLGNPGFYDAPIPDATSSKIRVEELCASEPLIDCPTGIRGEVTFFGGVVVDAFRPLETARNDRMSTYSVFDQDLRRIGSSKRIFALNSFNHLAAQKFLLPRAAAYSAGLINYYFRGRIDLEREPGMGQGWRIRNLGPERMQGRFGLYYDGQDGNRYPVALPASWASMNVEASGAANSADVISNLKFSPPTSPPPANPGEYVLVFSGTMGKESPLDPKLEFGEDGAVVGRVVKKGDLIVTSASGSSFATWRSSDFGKSWERRGSFFGRGATIRYLGGKTLLAPEAKSTDGGDTWSGLAGVDPYWPVLRANADVLPDGRLIGSVAILDNSRGIEVPKISISADGGETWGPQQDAPGLVNGISAIVATPSGALYTHSSVYVRTEACPPPYQAYQCDVYQPSFYRAASAGAPWVAVYGDALNEVVYLGKYVPDGTGLKLDENGKETLLANRFVRKTGGWVQEIVRSTDNGATWSVMNVPSEISDTTQEVWRLAYGADGAVYAYTHDASGANQQRMYKSGDAGSTWARVDSLPRDTENPGLYGLAMVPRSGEIPGLQRP